MKRPQQPWPNGRPLLRLEGITLAFGGLVALAEVSFGAKDRAVTALIGPNGAGKTTALNVISGVLRPASGRVIFDGEPIQGRPSHQIATLGLTRTFQNLQVFQNMSVLENVMVGGHTRGRAGFVRSFFRLGTRAEEARIREEAIQALEIVGLADRAAHSAGQLPYGLMKRVELARALAARPRLLLLDEPVAGLNPAETEEVAAMILRIKAAGVGVLLVDHDMSLVMSISDEVVVLNHGHVIARGRPAQVQADPAVIAAYLGQERF